MASERLWVAERKTRSGWTSTAWAWPARANAERLLDAARETFRSAEWRLVEYRRVEPKPKARIVATCLGCGKPQPCPSDCPAGTGYVEPKPSRKGGRRG